MHAEFTSDFKPVLLVCVFLLGLALALFVGILQAHSTEACTQPRKPYTLEANVLLVGLFLLGLGLALLPGILPKTQHRNMHAPKLNVSLGSGDAYLSCALLFGWFSTQERAH
jgi:ABC-type arginine/histidine transport system permease subunit